MQPRRHNDCMLPVRLARSRNRRGSQRQKSGLQRNTVHQYQGPRTGPIFWCWSGLRESNPRLMLGKHGYCHYTKPACGSMCVILRLRAGAAGGFRDLASAGKRKRRFEWSARSPQALCSHASKKKLGAGNCRRGRRGTGVRWRLLQCRKSGWVSVGRRDQVAATLGKPAQLTACRRWGRKAARRRSCS